MWGSFQQFKFGATDDTSVDSYVSDYEECYVLECDVVYSGRSFPAFLKKILYQSSDCSSTLKMEAAGSLEILVNFYQTT
jgi:hypothetical protein